jgi:nucleotide-binding universal stress UspA family protein
MNTYYNNILIPVDSCLNTQKAVARAIDLASAGRSIIHLTQLIRTRNPFGRLMPAAAYKVGSRLGRETNCTVLSLNTTKKHGVKEEIEILSHPLPTPYSKTPRTDTSWSGLTSVYGMLSGN